MVGPTSGFVSGWNESGKQVSTKSTRSSGRDSCSHAAGSAALCSGQQPAACRRQLIQRPPPRAKLAHSVHGRGVEGNKPRWIYEQNGWRRGVSLNHADCQFPLCFVQSSQTSVIDRNLRRVYLRCARHCWLSVCGATSCLSACLPSSCSRASCSNQAVSRLTAWLVLPGPVHTLPSTHLRPFSAPCCPCCDAD